MNLKSYPYVRSIHFERNIKEIERHNISYIVNNDKHTYESSDLANSVLNRDFIGVP
jgi:hypothetical protein